MQQIQMEAQELQRDAAAEFAADLETMMPGVAAQVAARFGRRPVALWQTGEWSAVRLRRA